MTLSIVIEIKLPINAYCWEPAEPHGEKGSSGTSELQKTYSSLRICNLFRSFAVQKFRGFYTHGGFSVIFYEGENICDFLFAFL